MKGGGVVVLMSFWGVGLENVLMKNVVIRGYSWVRLIVVFS